jgi:hypothetical protein
MFHYILNELEKIYHGESSQSFSEKGQVATNKWIH